MRFVYVFEHNKLYKIGVCKNIKARLGAIKRDYLRAEPEGEYNIQAVYYEQHFHPFSIERKLHRLFENKRIKKTQWFRLNNEDLENIKKKGFGPLLGIKNRGTTIEKMYKDLRTDLLSKGYQI